GEPSASVPKGTAARIPGECARAQDHGPLGAEEPAPVAIHYRIAGEAAVAESHLPPIVEESPAVEVVGTGGTTRAQREALQREGARGRHMDEAEARGAGRPFDNGALGPSPCQGQRAGHRR